MWRATEARAADPCLAGDRSCAADPCLVGDRSHGDDSCLAGDRLPAAGPCPVAIGSTRTFRVSVRGRIAPWPITAPRRPVVMCPPILARTIGSRPSIVRASRGPDGRRSDCGPRASRGPRSSRKRCGPSGLRSSRGRSRGSRGGRSFCGGRSGAADRRDRVHSRLAIVFTLAVLPLLLEPVARILVLSARAPVAAPSSGRGARSAWRASSGELPQPPLREPLQLGAGVLLTDPFERRQQLVALRRAKRGRHAVDDDRPVGLAGRHVSSVPAVSTSRPAWCASG